MSLTIHEIISILKFSFYLISLLNNMSKIYNRDISRSRNKRLEKQKTRETKDSRNKRLETQKFFRRSRKNFQYFKFLSLLKQKKRQL